MNWRLKLTEDGKIKYGQALVKETKKEAIERVYDSLRTDVPGVFGVNRGVYGTSRLFIENDHLMYSNRVGCRITLDGEPVESFDTHSLESFLEDEHPEVVRQVEARIIKEISKHSK